MYCSLCAPNSGGAFSAPLFRPVHLRTKGGFSTRHVLEPSVPSGSHTNKGPVSKWSQRRAASWSAVTRTPFSTQPGESCRHVQTSGLESEDHSDRGVGPRAQKHHRLRRCRRVAKFYEHNFSRKAHECICVEGCMSVAHVLQCQLDWT